MRIVDTQVVIVGGGCAALWLLCELASQGFDAILLEYNPLGRFASTRNQSWLHTGALYATVEPSSRDAAAGLLQTAEACKTATANIREFCKQYAPQALEDESGCIFLFADRKPARGALSRLEHLQISHHVVNRGDIVDLEPALRVDPNGSWLSELPQFGIETGDLPFDSYQVINALATRAVQIGGHIQQLACALTDLQFARDENTDQWEVDDGRTKIRAQICVAAVGALIPEFSDRISEAREDRAPFEIQKCVVAVLHKRVCNRIIAFRTPESDFLNLVPFRGGTTVNIGRLDKRASLLDRQISRAIYLDFADKLERFVPGIKHQLPIDAHFYVCQKIRNVDDSSHPGGLYGVRHYFWRPEAKNFFVFYPGKFTLAPQAAKEMCKDIATLVRPKSSENPQQSSDPFAISARPYYEDSTHVLDLDKSGRLIFVPTD